MMPDSDTPRANFRQPCNAKSEGGGERILAVMDRSDQARHKAAKIASPCLCSTPTLPSLPFQAYGRSHGPGRGHCVLRSIRRYWCTAFVLHPFPFVYRYDVCKHGSRVFRLPCAVIAWIFRPLYYRVQ